MPVFFFDITKKCLLLNSFLHVLYGAAADCGKWSCAGLAWLAWVVHAPEVQVLRLLAACSLCACMPCLLICESAL